jgi:hypothetical protein
MAAYAEPALPHLPYPWNNPTVLRITRTNAGDDLLTPRCPLCRHPLVARLTRAGPRYLCGCPDPKSNVARRI